MEVGGGYQAASLRHWTVFTVCLPSKQECWLQVTPPWRVGREDNRPQGKGRWDHNGPRAPGGHRVSHRPQRCLCLHPQRRMATQSRGPQLRQVRALRKSRNGSKMVHPRVPSFLTFHTPRILKCSLLLSGQTGIRHLMPHVEAPSEPWESCLYCRKECLVVITWPKMSLVTQEHQKWCPALIQMV